MKRLITGAAVVVIIAISVFIYFTFSSQYLLLRNGDTGRLLAAYKVDDHSEFSITFIHSVNKTPVTDVFEIRGGDIFVVKTIYYSFGAGVQTELEDGQRLDYGEDGSMIISGFDRKMDRLSYIVGTISDHILEISGSSVSLRELCGRNAPVIITCERRLFK